MTNLTVTVYTSGPSCMACTQTKRHLDRRGIAYTEVEIDDDTRSAILALGYTTAPVVDIHHAAGCCAPWGEHGYTRRIGGPGRHITHLVLENPRPITPIECKGQLGIWTPNDWVLDRAQAAI